MGMYPAAKKAKLQLDHHFISKALISCLKAESVNFSSSTVFPVSYWQLSHLKVTPAHFPFGVFFFTVDSCLFPFCFPLSLSAGSWRLWNWSGNINHTFISQTIHTPPPPFVPPCSFLPLMLACRAFSPQLFLRCHRSECPLHRLNASVREGLMRVKLTEGPGINTPQEGLDSSMF